MQYEEQKENEAAEGDLQEQIARRIVSFSQDDIEDSRMHRVEEKREENVFPFFYQKKKKNYTTAW